MHSNLALHSTPPLPEALSGAQLNRLQQAIADLSAAQLNWASGYLAGMGASRVQPVTEPSVTPLTVLYASQTGNSHAFAETLCRAAESQGIATRLISVEAYNPRDLAKERLLLLIVSTHGEGDPPENARPLYQFLHGSRAPQLNALKFSVFGLGDSSYEHFCAAARVFDQRLEALGGERLLPHVEADIDFQTPGSTWIPQILDRVEPLLNESGERLASISPIRPTQRISRHNPFSAKLLETRRITTSDAVADVRHLALQIDPAQIRYQPGDSLGVWFHNDPQLIGEILQLTALNADHPVRLGDDRLSLQEALAKRLELTQLHPTLVSRWAAVSDSTALQQLQHDRSALREFCRTHQLVDLIAAHPATVDAVQLVELLQPLQPRLYSIASSQLEYEDEIHLTVAVHRHQAHGRDHLGSASGFLGGRLQEGEKVEIYVVENSGFRLPENSDTPLIMIGAGTGIAPYRAFLQQRAAQGAGGRNWLIFGNRHFQRDFLYQTEWLGYRASGDLHRSTLAFSRDGIADAYVQERLLEQGETLYHWLDEGAHIYVCGAVAMEEGVRHALASVLSQQAGLSETAALETIARLQNEGRYQRDVY